MYRIQFKYLLNNWGSPETVLPLISLKLTLCLQLLYTICAVSKNLGLFGTKTLSNFCITSFHFKSTFGAQKSIKHN